MKAGENEEVRKIYTGNRTVDNVLAGLNERALKRGIELQIEGSLPVIDNIAPADIEMLFELLVCNAMDLASDEDGIKECIIKVRTGAYYEVLIVEVQEKLNRGSWGKKKKSLSLRELQRKLLFSTETQYFRERI